MKRQTRGESEGRNNQSQFILNFVTRGLLARMFLCNCVRNGSRFDILEPDTDINHSPSQKLV